jgi:hypothetical protein
MVTEYHTGPRRNIFSSLYNNCDIAGQAKPSHDKPVASGGDTLAHGEGHKEQSAGNDADNNDKQDKAEVKNSRPQTLDDCRNSVVTQ